MHHWLHSLMDRTTDFGSVGEGSNPSAVTNIQSITLLKIFLGAFFQEKDVLLGTKDVNQITKF